MHTSHDLDRGETLQLRMGEKEKLYIFYTNMTKCIVSLCYLMFSLKKEVIFSVKMANKNACIFHRNLVSPCATEMENLVKSVIKKSFREKL